MRRYLPEGCVASLPARNELAGEDEHDDGEEAGEKLSRVNAEGREDDEEPCRAREKVAGVAEQPPLVGVHALRGTHAGPNVNRPGLRPRRGPEAL